jgi:uncharacterized spore protein YtfJ
MKVTDAIGAARDAVTVKRVYGEPFEQDGATVIPAAFVSGGAGGGEGHDAEKNQEGVGGGFGVSARPAGAFVIRNGDATWRPAVDPNRVVLVLGAVVVAWLLSRPRLVRARAAVRLDD